MEPAMLAVAFFTAQSAAVSPELSAADNLMSEATTLLDTCVNRNISQLYRSAESASDIAAAVMSACRNDLNSLVLAYRGYAMVWARVRETRFDLASFAEHMRQYEAERERFYREATIRSVIRRRQMESQPSRSE